MFPTARISELQWRLPGHVPWDSVCPDRWISSPPLGPLFQSNLVHVGGTRLSAVPEGQEPSEIRSSTQAFRKWSQSFELFESACPGSYLSVMLTTWSCCAIFLVICSQRADVQSQFCDPAWPWDRSSASVCLVLFPAGRHELRARGYKVSLGDRIWVAKWSTANSWETVFLTDRNHGYSALLWQAACFRDAFCRQSPQCEAGPFS